MLMNVPIGVGQMVLLTTLEIAMRDVVVKLDVSTREKSVLFGVGFFLIDVRITFVKVGKKVK